MCVKHIEMKVNLELCLVGGYTFQQYFMLYDELPTRFVIEPYFLKVQSPWQMMSDKFNPNMVGIRGLLFKFSFPLNGALEISDKFFSCFFFDFNHILLSFSFCKYNSLRWYL